MSQFQELKHVAKHIHVKHESDGVISVLMRCCDDPSTDQWHSFHVKPDTSHEEIKSFIDRSRSQCEAQHGARTRACTIIEQEFKP